MAAVAPLGYAFDYSKKNLGNTKPQRRLALPADRYPVPDSASDGAPVFPTAVPTPLSPTCHHRAGAQRLTTVRVHPAPGD